MPAEGSQNDPVRALVKFGQDFLLTHRYTHLFTSLFLAFEVVLLAVIVKKVAYTEIDYSTYLQQADLYVNKKFRNYSAIKGESGPCVYPAGHLYFYAWILRHVQPAKAGFSFSLLPGSDFMPNDLLPVQLVFGALYLVSFALVMDIYRLASGSVDGWRRVKASAAFPPALHLTTLAMSKRLHSIYVLRMFNDPVAMTIFYLAVWLLCKRATMLACITFSIALSIKMNLLLFLPAWAVILFTSYGLAALLPASLILLVQLVLGWPFLSVSSSEYLSGAFDFSRAFLYKWTVNWRFLQEATFASNRFAKVLLVLHLGTLLVFATFRWTELGRKGPARWIKEDVLGQGIGPRYFPTPRFMAMTLFTSNLIGITFSRSLHYQFFSWYAHQIPFLLWAARLPIAVKVAIPIAIAYGWETFPSTSTSSLGLFAAHVALLWGVWASGEGNALTDRIHVGLNAATEKAVR